MTENNDEIFGAFGFSLNRKTKKKVEPKKEELISIVPPTDRDGAGYVVSGTGGATSSSINLNNNSTTVKDDIKLIQSYRDVSMHPEVDQMITHIRNEAISGDKEVAELNIDALEIGEGIKKKINLEFDNIIKMLDFNNNAADMFQSFYIDGRLFHHLVVDPKREDLGIQEMRLIDSLSIRKIREVIKETDPKTDVEVVKGVKEYFVYDPKHETSKRRSAIAASTSTSSVIKLSTESVSYITSGLLDTSRTRVIGHLDKVLKPVNQLRMMEDALVIYRIARAPERRIFYVDVDRMQPAKAKQYIASLMNEHRNKMSYNAETGSLTNGSRTMSMLEDFWLPRQQGNKGTEVTNLAGGQNLGEVDDILYMQKKLYKAGNVPVSRLEQEDGGGGIIGIGRTSELTRNEQFFQKFVKSLRRRFSRLIIDTLGTQCVLKKICKPEEWDKWVTEVYVDFIEDSYFTELKEAEVMGERIDRLDRVSQYVGEYFSREYVMKKILMMSDDEYETMNEQIKKEKEDEVVVTGDEEEEEFDAPTPKTKKNPEPEDEEEEEEKAPVATKPEPKIDASKVKTKKVIPK